LQLVGDGSMLARTTGVELGPTLLAHAAQTGCGPFLRLYLPAPTMAFTGRDRVTPGYAAAVETARLHGFAPVLRAPGGRAAAFHEDTLCIEITAHDENPRRAVTARFAELGRAVAAALRTLGVPAQVGAVPGEHCPGEHSVNVAGRYKLVGTAQRLTRHGWLLGASILIRRVEPVRAVTVSVYDALGLPFVADSMAGVVRWIPGIGVDDVASAVLAELGRRASLMPIDLSGGRSLTADSRETGGATCAMSLG